MRTFGLIVVSIVMFVPMWCRASDKPAATQPVRPIKVGWIVSKNTFQVPYGHGNDNFDSVTVIHKRFVDPEIELFAIIEPGTETDDDVIEVVTDNFPQDHVLDGTDAKSLAFLDVIVCSRDWAVNRDVLVAVRQAVEGGVGLLRQMPLWAAKTDPNTGEIVGDPHSDAANALERVSGSEYFNQRPLTDCRVVADHPLVYGLRNILPDGKITISALSGSKGIVHGTPLIVLDADLASLENVDQNGKPLDGKEVAAPQDAKIFCPLFISHIGKGRVVACQFESIPRAIVKASKGRFYINCCQWLAHRPIH